MLLRRFGISEIYELFHANIQDHCDSGMWREISRERSSGDMIEDEHVTLNLQVTSICNKCIEECVL